MNPPSKGSPSSWLIAGTGPNLADQKTLSIAGSPANIAPTSATIANAGAVGRNIGSAFTTTGGLAPYTYAITANPNSCAVTIVGAQLQSTVNPIAGTTGAKSLTIRTTDANLRTFSATYTLTLT